MTQAFENTAAAVEFSLRLFGLLRKSGIQLSSLQTTTCTRAIVLTRAVAAPELSGIYRVTLINRKEDLAGLQQIYAMLLDVYFPDSSDADGLPPELEQEQVITVHHQLSLGEAKTAGDDEESAETEGYSTHEVDHHKDFRLMPKGNFPAVLKALEKIARKHAGLTRRKSKRSKRPGIVDLRASVRRSVRFDGEILDWRFKKRMPTHTRLVVLADVSGSMEMYSVFLLNFLHLLYAHQRLKVEIFVFSTELQPLTKYFRQKNFRSILNDISVHFSGWSGGTKIGQAVASLNEGYAATVNKKTLVTIMSDGWDTGDVELLDREMARLAKRAKAVVWINPLMGDSSYEPLAVGMATARPYCDEFISGHSIDSLENFANLNYRLGAG